MSNQLVLDFWLSTLYRQELSKTNPRLLVCGSRTMGRLHRDLVAPELINTPPNTVVVHGCAPGADMIAAAVALELGRQVEGHPADWERYGVTAGFKRNIEMLESGVQMVLAFWDGESRGTRHTLDQARLRGIPCRIVEFSPSGTCRL